MATNDKIHPFEQAGLGKAPFRYCGATERRGPIVTVHSDGTRTEVGAPGQPMGVCDYCGQGIAICCEIMSADGTRFVVGSDCVLKTNASGTRLRTEVERAITHARKGREETRIDAARTKLLKEPIREALARRKAPSGSQSANALEWAEWMMRHAGHTGRLRAARVVEAAS